LCASLPLFVMPLLAGCSWSNQTGAPADSAKDGAPPSAVAPASPLTPAQRVGYRYPEDPPVLDGPDLQGFVGGFRHKVVLLHFWASWSQRSVEEIDELARLQDNLVDSEFQVISCCLDPPADWRSRTLPALRRAGANFPCIVIPTEAKPQVKDWLDPNWSYDLPARFLLDRHGQIVARSASSAPLAGVLEEARRLVR
jgi:hypothetical protein